MTVGLIGYGCGMGLATTFGYILLQRGMPPFWLMFWTVVGGTLAAGGANAINMYVDRDIDRIMKRTQGRPLVTGEMRNMSSRRVAAETDTGAFLSPSAAATSR